MIDKAEEHKSQQDRNEKLVADSLSLTAREQAAGGPAVIMTSLQIGVKRQQRLLKWIVFAVFFAVVLSVLLAVAFTYINANAITAKKSCGASNQLRMNDREVWKDFLSLPVEYAQTPAQVIVRRKNLADLNVLLDKTFVLRRC